MDWPDAKTKAHHVRAWGIKVSEGTCNCMEISGRAGALVVSDELTLAFVL